MILFDDTTSSINEDSSKNLNLSHLTEEDAGVNEDTGSDAEIGIRINKAGRNHPHTILFLPYQNGMTGIWTDTTTGYNGRVILMSDMGNNLAFSLITKKATNDDCTGHNRIIRCLLSKLIK